MSKTAFLFPGQGAQRVGMGREMTESLPAARGLYDRASELLGYDLAQLCFEGPAESLDSTVYSQPALFVTSLAALEVLRSESPEVVDSCDTVAGLSLGEYTALVTAGVLDFEDGLTLVKARGEAMQEAADAHPSGMVSVLGLELEQVQALCDEARVDQILEIANLLCPGNIVVSGANDACHRLAELARAAGAMKVVPIAVAGAFHTSLMDSAVNQLAQVLDGMSLRRAAIPIISNVDAKPHVDPDEIRPLLLRQVVSPVLWEASMRSLLATQHTQFYELGPGRVLRGLLRRIDRKTTCENIAA